MQKRAFVGTPNRRLPGTPVFCVVPTALASCFAAASFVVGTLDAFTHPLPRDGTDPQDSPIGYLTPRTATAKNKTQDPSAAQDDKKRVETRPQTALILRVLRVRSLP